MRRVFAVTTKGNLHESELLKQLRIQAEVVRLAGTTGESGVRELVGELLARVEGLDEVMDLDEPRTGNA